MSRYFWFKLWLTRLRIKTIIWGFYVSYKIGHMSKHGEYDLKLGISYNSKKYYDDGLYSPRKEYAKKSRFLRFDVILFHIEFGYWGKKEKGKEIGELQQ